MDMDFVFFVSLSLAWGVGRLMDMDFVSLLGFRC